MNEQKTEFQASASHISLMHRPYGPRVHLSEDVTPASAASGPDITIIPPADTGDDLSPSQAAKAYLDSFKKPKPESGAEAAADPEDELAQANTGPEEVPGEEPEGDDPEAEKLPPIERPRSWSKDADDDWNALPRERQEKIAAADRAREADINRRINEAAETAKAAKAEVAKAEQAKQTYEAKLPALMQALHNINNTAFSDIKSQDDADLLAQVDPARWVQWKAHQDRMAQTNFELQQAENGKAAKHQSDWNKHVGAENTKAAEVIPELADPEKSKVFYKYAVDRLKALGFDNQHVDDLVNGKAMLSIHDHRLQQVLWSDFQLDGMQKAKVAAVTKLAAKPVPPVQRPGVQRAPGVAASDRVQALDSKLTNSGSLADATALYMAQQNAQRRRSA